MKGKKQQRTIGSIIKIDLGNGFHSYGRILPDCAFAFYDYKTKENISDLQRIVFSPVLFIASVYNDAITKGVWIKIGKLPLEQSLLASPPEFIQDPIHPDKFKIKNYQLNTQTPATFEECIGMERACVWEPHAIINRLNDYFENRITNKMDFYDRPELFRKAKPWEFCLLPSFDITCKVEYI
jgi:hypothetical protein